MTVDYYPSETHTQSLQKRIIFKFSQKTILSKNSYLVNELVILLLKKSFQLYIEAVKFSVYRMFATHLSHKGIIRRSG
jgi:hypothetical protein